MSAPSARRDGRRAYLVPLAFGLFAALLLFLPTLLHGAFGQVSVSYLSLATNALMLAVLALSWDILARTGQLSLAHAAFYGAGAYTVAILGRLTEWPLGVGVPLGGVVAALLALFLGSVTLRLRGIYFAIATLSFTEVLRATVQQLPAGVAGVNVSALFRPSFVEGMERWELAFICNERYFWVYAALLLLSVLVSLLLAHSRLKQAFTALRTNEEVAAVMGVQPARHKLLAFVISSFLVGLLGGLEAHRIGSVNPLATFSVETTVLALVTPIFGGLYTTLGPVLGAGLLAGLEETLKRNVASGYLIGYGVVLVLSVLLMPRGVVGVLRGLFQRRRR